MLTLPVLYLAYYDIYSLPTLCLHSTLPCIDFMRFTMGDVPGRGFSLLAHSTDTESFYNITGTDFTR